MMRIILKPAGLAILLGAFATLTGIVLFLTTRMKAAGTDAANPASAAIIPAAKGPAEDMAATGTLRNVGMEGDYTPAVPYDNKANLSGIVANGWRDDSSWAPVEVNYAKETAPGEVHGGKTCQRIEVRHMTITGQPCAVQFNQTLKLELGKQYHGSLFLKADKPADVEVSLRQADPPFHYYGANKAHIGANWTEIGVDATIKEDPKVYLMVKLSTVGTFWVDDASLSEKK